jgi:hypothetical protein
MSTTARKIRKRRRHASLERAAFFGGTPVPPFQHPVKVGTPIAERAVSVHRADRRIDATMSRLGLYDAIRKHLGIGKNGRGR